MNGNGITYEDVILAQSREEYEDKLLKENQRLNNVLNELEKWVKEEIENIKMNYSQVNGNYFNMSYVIDTYENVLDKLNELKESDK